MPRIQRAVGLTGGLEVARDAVGIEVIVVVLQQGRADASTLEVGAHCQEGEVVVGFLRMVLLEGLVEGFEPWRVVTAGPAQAPRVLRRFGDRPGAVEPPRNPVTVRGRGDVSVIAGGGRDAQVLTAQRP